MKKKKVVLYLALSACFLGGCQKTPDQQIVREKGVDSIAQYQQDTEQTYSETESTDGQTKENKLAQKLEAPDHYESAVQSQDGSLEIVCNAEVEIPNVSQVDVYQVSQRIFNQELIDTFTRTFAGSDAVYEAESYSSTGKKTLVLPQLSDSENRFFGIFERGEEEFLLFLKNDIVMPIIMEIQKIDRESIDGYGRNAYSWINVQSMPERSEELSDAAVEERAGITAEEAQEIADEKVEQLGLNEMKARERILSLHQVWKGEGELTYPDAGWNICYTREIEGFPVTYDMGEGGNLASIDDDVTVPWAYERLEIVVNKNGVQQVHCYNLYEVEGKTVENVKLKSFSEIMSIFEEMIQIQNASMREGGILSKKIQVSQIKLGYSRIYDPNSAEKTGLLVPVWDFYGSEQNESTWEGKNYQYEGGDPLLSKMTINAIDGTIIKRELGY